MSDVSRSGLKMNVLREKKEFLAEAIKDYSKKYEHTPDEVQDVFDKIKVCFEFYKESLRDILKERDIVLYLPSEILKKAQEENIIEDAELWLEYIDDLNEIIQSQVPSAAAILKAKVVEKYMDKPQKSWEVLNKLFNPKLLKINKSSRDIKLPDNKPVYKPEEMGLNKYCYNEFINFCRKHKSIKHIWLHGSRAVGNYTERADIDCIADINDYEEYKKICQELIYLPLPQRIDFAQMNDIQDEFFVRVTDKAKVIYRAEDFE